MSLLESQRSKQRTKLVIYGKSEVVVFVEVFLSKWHVARTVYCRYGGNIDFLLGKVASQSESACKEYQTGQSKDLQEWIKLYI